MPASKIEMTINKIDLKPANTKFLTDHVWNNYDASMKALQEVVVLFMADFNSDPVIDVGYVVDQTDQKTREQFNIHIGVTTVTSVEVIQGADHLLELKDKSAAVVRNDLLDAFDVFAAPFKKVIYESNNKELVSPGLLFPVRRLLGDLYSGMLQCKGEVYFSEKPWAYGSSFRVVCYPNPAQKDLMISLLIHSPRVESPEVVS